MTPGAAASTPKDGPLTAEAVLASTEDVLRRYGPAKATVLDVARALGVSHGTVYRHFPTKAALREAVTHRWLDRVHAGLPEIANGPGTAPEKLRAWLSALSTAKRRKVLDDPELYATYHVLVAEHSAVIDEHLAELVGQLRRIIEAGMAAGEFRAVDPALGAQAVFDATVRFHDPAYAGRWSAPDIDDAFNAVCDLILNGLLTNKG